MSSQAAADGERLGAVCLFFFSSRRRHTRLQGDWSSDVCSSDLYPNHLLIASMGSFSESLPVSATVYPAARARCREAFLDRKSTRLNSSHLVISYAVFCLKKKTTPRTKPSPRPRASSNTTGL